MKKLALWGVVLLVNLNSIGVAQNNTNNGNITNNNLNDLGNNNIGNNNISNLNSNRPKNNSNKALNSNSQNVKNNSLSNPQSTNGFNNGAGANLNSLNPATNAPQNGFSVPPTNAAPLNVPSNSAPTNVPLNAVPQNGVTSEVSNPIPASDSVSQPVEAPPSGPVFDPEKAEAEERISQNLRTLLQADLSKFCMDYCSILSLSVESQEVFQPSQANLGFEAEGASTTGRKFSQKGAKAEILVDARFGTLNTMRLQSLLQKLIQKYPTTLGLTWSTVSFPDNGLASRSEAEVRTDFASQIRSQLERAVTEFCPRECKINGIEVRVNRSGVDEIRDGNLSRYLFAQDAKGALHVKGVKANLSINSLMEDKRKNRILGLMRQMLSPFGEVILNVSEIEFPTASEEILADLEEKRKDPYGLEKLKSLLNLMRDYANTKEIIKETVSNSENSLEQSDKLSHSETSESSTQSNEKSSKEQLNEKNSSSSNSSNSSSSNSEKNSLDKSTKESSESSASLFTPEFWTTERMILAAGGFVVLLVLFFVGMRFVATGKRVQAHYAENMNRKGGMGQGAGGPMQPAGMVYGPAYAPPTGMLGGNYQEGVSPGGQRMGAPPSGGGESNVSEKIQVRMQIDSLKGEIFEYFFNNPIISRDVIGRILKEDGVEVSAKYVVILGDMIFFDVLKETELSQEVFTLGEYVHVNPPVVTELEQLELLRNLKLKLTAGKIRKIANKTLDIFDFMRNKTARQILELIREETPKTQSIVFTQLSAEKRRQIFELLTSHERIEVLKELSKNDNVAREYLFNVCEALKRKAQRKSGFTGENVHGSDVLQDLLERADLLQQRQLMESLDQTNPEASRQIRSRLISIETLPFLKDGLLLEIFLGLEPGLLVTFLAGTREHIRSLILSKCPVDMAREWLSMMDTVKIVDAETYRLVELQVITKIRGFANQGMVNLLYINEALYPPSYDSSTVFLDRENQQGRRGFRISRPLVS